MDHTQKLRVLADERRLQIIELLLRHNYCVRALARKLDVTEAAVSQHLKVLREAGLLIGEKRGYYMHYDVDRQMLRALADEIYALAELQREPCSPQQGGCAPEEAKNCHNHGPHGRHGHGEGCRGEAPRCHQHGAGQACSDEVKEFCHGKGYGHAGRPRACRDENAVPCTQQTRVFCHGEGHGHAHGEGRAQRGENCNRRAEGEDRATGQAGTPCARRHAHHGAGCRDAEGSHGRPEGAQEQRRFRRSSARHDGGER